MSSLWTWRKGVSKTHGTGASARRLAVSQTQANVGESGVPGDRGVALVSRARSLQSRLNALLAMALAIGVGIAMLMWYYGDMLHVPPQRARATRAVAAPRNEMHPLPLGNITLPAVPVSATPGSDPKGAVVIADSTDSGPTPIGPVLPLTALKRQISPESAWRDASRPSRRVARRLSGMVFSPIESAGSDGGGSRDTMEKGESRSRRLHTDGSDEGGTRGVALSSLLHPTVIPAASAQLLPQQRLLLPKGTFIDCTLETAIDSSLPGMTTCVTAADTFSADGTVVLLERGTKLVGETRGQVRQGATRIFVIWTEARTPAGVVVRLDSPGTDALGRSGLTGNVNRHFWQRFGAALLVSTLDGVVQSQLQSATGTVVVEPTAPADVMTETLRDSADIPPTISVPNGARIQVLVARDIDFRSVYELIPLSR